MEERTLISCTLVGLALIACSAMPAGAADGDEWAEVMTRTVAAGRHDTWALEWLETLCDTIGPRLSGSPQMDAASAFAERTMTAAGFDRVWTEEVTVPHWVRGTESARITAPAVHELRISGLGRSVGTLPGGVTAEVLVVHDYDELDARAEEAEGRIVLFNPAWEGYGSVVKYRHGGAAAAARHGAVAALVRSATGRSLDTPHTGVMAYADDAPRIPAAAVTVEGAALIERLSRRGPVTVHLEMEARTLGETTDETVIAELRGRELPEEIVVVGGHLDSWDVGPGAHDDGAGCAITLGAARLLIELGLRPRRTVRVVLFAAEEFGGHAGDAYLEAHRDELDRHVAALESDSGSYPPDGFSVKADEAVVDRIAELAAPLAAAGGGKVRAGWAGVDIGPIVEAGVPGIAHRTANEHYFDVHHSPADTFDKVDPDDLAANVAVVAALVWAIAEDPVSLREPASDRD
jgi:hypothetical protein